VAHAPQLHGQAVVHVAGIAYKKYFHHSKVALILRIVKK
jgi:hypothetical protein